MNPQSPDTERRSAVSIELSVKWSRYLAVRDDRSHRELLRAVDRFIRAESRRMLASQAHLAEEAAQEALLGVERRIATMEAPDHPAAYIRKVLVNKISDVLQRESKRRIREEWYSEPEVINVDLTPTTDWHDFLGVLRDAISQDEFWTLVLRHHFEFSYDEIGELLEKQPGAIRQIALRGRRKACERMARLEGRVPAWLDLGGDNGGTARRAGATETETDDNPRRVVDDSEPGDPRSLGGEVTGLGGAANPQVELPVAEPPPTSSGSSIAGLVRRVPTVGKRWLLTSPSSVLPLVVLLAVPAVAQTREPGSLAVRTPTTVGVADASDGTAGTAGTGRGKKVGALPDQPPAGPSTGRGGEKPGADNAGSTDGLQQLATTTTTAVPIDEKTTTLSTPTEPLAPTTTASATAPASAGQDSAATTPLPPLIPTTIPPRPSVAATTTPTTARPSQIRRALTSRAATTAATSARTTRRTTTTAARTTSRVTAATPTTARATTAITPPASLTTTTTPVVEQTTTTATPPTTAPPTTPATTVPPTTEPTTTTTAPTTTIPATDPPTTTLPTTTTVPATTTTEPNTTTSFSIPPI